MIALQCMLVSLSVLLVTLLISSPPMAKVLPQVVTWWVSMVIALVVGLYSVWRLIRLFA